jgi:CBS domain-containing protein
MKARDIMTSDVVCLNQDLDIHECEKLLLERRISGAPVVDDEGHLLGVLSKTDIVSHHFVSGQEEGGGEDSLVIEGETGAHVFEYNSPRARDLMSPVPCTATESSTLRELAGLMVQREVHRVIITRRWKVVGIVSTMDILRAIAAPPTRIIRASAARRSLSSHPQVSP